MLSHRHWTTFILLLFFTIACEGYNYGNDTIFDARDLEVRAGPGAGIPAPHKLRIVAVGDVHGDYDRFLDILKYLEVVDQDGKWSGKVDVFVQLGDLMDRGPDTKKLFEYLDKLRNEAPRLKGRVYTLLGNHEVDNLMYNWDFVNPEELKTFGETGREDINVLRDLRRRALSSGAIGQSLADNYLGALLLPLYPNKLVNIPYEKEKEKESQFSHSAIAFVHGGLRPAGSKKRGYKKLLPFPTRINSIAQGLVRDLQFFLATNVKKLRFEQEGTLNPPQKLFWDAKGPLWYRGLADSPNCGEVEKMLKNIGARRMVVGHTRDDEGIIENCDGKIIVIDTGITRWEVVESHSLPNEYEWEKWEGGRLSALDIRYTFDDEGKQTEVVHAVYPGLEKPRDSVRLPDIPF